MSDAWYKKPFELTPYMDDFGRQWDPWTGEQIGGPLGDSPAERWFAERMGRKFGDPMLACGLQFDSGYFSLDVIVARMSFGFARDVARDAHMRNVVHGYRFGAMTVNPSAVLRGPYGA